MKYSSVVLACASSLIGLAAAQTGKMFVSSGLVTGALNGAQGFDSLCRSEASDHYVGIVSSETEQLDAINRFHDGYDYVNWFESNPLGNKTTLFGLSVNIVVETFHGLTDKTGSIPVTPNTAFTGTKYSGLVSSGDNGNCNSWTDGTAGVYRGEAGSPSYPSGEDSKWISTANNDCNNQNYIYCIEQELVVCVFTTTNSYPIDTNVTSLHNACDAESPHFVAKALVDTTTEAIRDIFPGEEGSYLIINTAGQVVNSLRYDLLNSGTINGRNILTREQDVLSVEVWTGKDGDNCLDFTDATNGESSVIGQSDATDAATLFTDSTGACDGSRHLYCVQQDQIGTASVHGDPHFTGFDGSKYNFMGADGEIFAIISDVGFALNAEFRRMKIYGHDGTWMTKVGIRSGEETLAYDPRFGLLVNDKLISADLKTNQFTITKTEKGFHLISSGYSVEVTAVGFRTEFGLNEHFLDVQVSLLSKPVKPHGVLGQTASFIVEDRKPEAISSNDENGKGVVQGIWSDYLVHDGITGIDFNFSSFSAPQSAQRVSMKETRSMVNIVGSFVGFSPDL